LSQVSQLGQLETKRQAKESSTLSLFDKLTAIAYKMFGAQGRKFASSSPEMRDQILKSNLRITPEALVSLAMFMAVLSVIPVVICVVLGLVLHVIFLFLVVIAPPIVFVLIWNLPKVSAGSRSEGIDNELPMLIGFLGVLSGGGVSPISTLRRIAGMQKVFPASAREARRILIDIDVFGTDPITAFETAAKYMSNKPFAEFLYGYTTVLKVGGDVKNYVNNKLKETLDGSTSKVRRITDSVGTLAEAYLTVTAVMGITLFSLFQLEGVIAHNNSGLQTLYIFSYLVVPAISALFIFIIDGTQPKQPYFNKRPYYVLLACMPIGLVLFVLPIPLGLALHVSLALSSILVIPVVVAFRQSANRGGLEKALPDFIRDVAEGRKIGLSPEGAIEQLASKNYGRLSKSIKTMASQISWGLPILKVIQTFADSVDSWITMAIGTLMVEVVDVGGGTVSAFSTMADFTRKVNEIEADKKAALRSYIFVVYMAGIMLVLTTFMMVYFLSTPIKFAGVAASLPGVTITPATVQNLLTASIFDGWVIGFVAGKMGGGTVADGFKHALALVMVGALMVAVAPIVLHHPI
jgi:archaeal flagellar protein FlaJ